MSTTAHPVSRSTATEIRVVPVEQLAVRPERAAELLSMSDDFFRKHVLPDIGHCGGLRRPPALGARKGPHSVARVQRGA